jgi:hypothetical protein
VVVFRVHEVSRRREATKAEPRAEIGRYDCQFPIIALPTILAIALFFRCYGLMSLFPILVDESIYLRWAEIIDHQGQWFISLLDAKQPFSYWIYALLRKIAPEADPLLAARLVSVWAGVTATGLLFAIGRRLDGMTTGLLAALFYGLMPYGALYDRLAYTDALVNCFGLAITFASIDYFADALPTWTRVMIVGLLVGLAFFTKSTALLFAPVPIVAAALWHGNEPRLVFARLVVIYAVAAVFPLISYVMVPTAPNFGINNLLVHHTSFFTSLDTLLSNPLINVPRNSMLVAEYLDSYVTAPFALASSAAIIYLVLRKDRRIWLAFPLLIFPLTLEIFTLEYLPSRYVFSHVWPLALFTAIAVADVARFVRLRRAKPLAILVLVAPLTIASTTLLVSPGSQLHATDEGEFLSSGPFSGYGIPEAINFMRQEATKGPLTILTDPIWGTPADAIYPYLNLKNGIRVYDAWWTQLSSREAILPKKSIDVMRSQYERVSAGHVDFPALSKVFYVTDTNYYTPEDVWKRSPDARLTARFPKRNGKDYIDVYRLK